MLYKLRRSGSYMEFSVRFRQLYEMRLLFGHHHGVMSATPLDAWQFEGLRVAYNDSVHDVLRGFDKGAGGATPTQDVVHSLALSRLESAHHRQKEAYYARALFNKGLAQSRSLMLARKIAAGEISLEPAKDRYAYDAVIVGALVNQSDTNPSRAGAARYLNAANRTWGGVNDDDVRHAIARFKRRTAPYDRQWLVLAALENAGRELYKFICARAPVGMRADGMEMAALAIDHPDSARVFCDALDAWRPATPAAWAALDKQLVAMRSRLAVLLVEQARRAA